MPSKVFQGFGGLQSVRLDPQVTFGGLRLVGVVAFADHRRRFNLVIGT